MKNSALIVSFSSLLITTFFYILWIEDSLEIGHNSSQETAITQNVTKDIVEPTIVSAIPEKEESLQEYNKWLTSGKNAEKNKDIVSALRYYSWALSFHDNKDLEKHVESLSKEVNKQNQVMLSQYKIWKKALLLESQKKYLSAIDLYSQLQKQGWFPEEVKSKIDYCQKELKNAKLYDNHLISAMTAEEQGNFYQAISIYKKILSASPNDKEVLQKIKKIKKLNSIHIKAAKNVALWQKQHRYVYCLRYLQHNSINKNYFKNTIRELQKKVKEQMAYVPEGDFIFGSDQEKDEAPRQKIHLLAFYMDRYEVTNYEYYLYVKSTKAVPPENWSNNRPQKGEENFPVTGISWQEAIEYSKWIGKTLPTEQQWEKAARGVNGNTYPWGNEFKVGYANTLEQKTRNVVSVGSFSQGTSPFGCYDMIGNVMEWTIDNYQAYEDNPNFLLIRSGYKVARGGSWYYKGGILHCSRRYPQEPNVKMLALGFRCSIDADKLEIMGKDNR